MANRVYFYNLDHRLRVYADRPGTISGLSEWPYDVPFSYRVLLSGAPQLCASLISDGFEHDDPDNRTPLWAISGEFDTGYARLRKLLVALSVLAAAPRPSLLQRFARGLRGAGSSTVARLPDLQRAIAETLQFLDAHRNRHQLLETIELDVRGTDDPQALRRCARTSWHAALLPAPPSTHCPLPRSGPRTCSRLWPPGAMTVRSPCCTGCA